jgi:peptidoglycan/xylan/chitin deacetylase (PgdA/CDA1 family)
MQLSSQAKTLAVTALDISGIAWLLKPFFGGRGTILCLHRVITPDTKTLSPGLAISSAQLEAILKLLRDKKWDVVPLNEVPERLRARSRGRHFVAVTLDDGYSDNLHVAVPLFRKYGTPFCVFANSGILDRSAIPWYSIVEQIVQGTEELVIEHEVKGELHFSCQMHEEKRAALRQLLQLGWSNQPAMRKAVRNYCLKKGATVESLINELYLSWDELRTIAEDPLGTVGSHTVSHERLTELSEVAAYQEMKVDREKLQNQLGRPIEDIAYPFGSHTECGAREFALAREIGYLRGVTTERWNLFPEHLNNLLALPRVTISMAHSANARFTRVSAYGAWNAACALLR